jgi:FkbM family methyltransferase
VAGKRISDALYRRWLEVKKPATGTFSGVDSEGYYYVAEPDFSRRVFVSHQRRLGYYSNGVLARVNNLASEYGVLELELLPDDQVVDVGAHSGEFGLWVERFGAHYLAMEPDPVAYGALQRNFPNGHNLNVAAGSEEGSLEFFLNTSTGDSSLVNKAARSIRTAVRPLDSVVAEIFPRGIIAVLKVEAEGYEPEVLLGAEKTLARTRIVTVDAGEERQGKSTAPECLNFLYQRGFELDFVYLKRGIFKLRNRALG